MTQDRAKKQANQKGHRAEQVARFFLALKGYSLLEKRWKSPFGEIDLIMRQGETLVFVEVKARPCVEEAAYAVTPRQQDRIRSSALAYVAHQGLSVDQDMRFDVVFIVPWQPPVHWMNVF